MVLIVLITGSPREYLEAYMFPVLLPAIEQMLKAAKENKVFEVCLQVIFLFSKLTYYLVFRVTNTIVEWTEIKPLVLNKASARYKNYIWIDHRQ